MADYPPPAQTLPAFNPAEFRTNSTPLTIAEGEKYFLTFPNAQGTENLASANVSGDLTITNPSTFGTVYGYGATKPTSGTSIHNTAFGYQAGIGLVNTTAGGGNSAFGALTFADINGAAENNTAVGHNALRRVTTGDGNTQVGMTTNALALNLTTGNNNTLIGYNASVSGTGISTSTAIGYLAQATASNQIVLGTTSETVRYNKVSPLYTTYSPSTSADIGYTTTATITYPTTTTNVIASLASVPAGLWLIQVMLNMNAGPAIINVRNGGTVVGFVPSVTRTTDWYSGSVITTISTGTATLDILPLAAGVTGTNASGTGQSVRFTRLA